MALSYCPFLKFTCYQLVKCFFFFSFFLKIYLFYLVIFGCVGSSLLCAGFPSCGEQGLLFIVVRGLLIAVASFVMEHGL